MAAIRVAAGETAVADDGDVAPVVPTLSVDELCRRVHPRLVGALRLYLGDAELARELAQDTLVRVVERGAEVTAMDRPEGWVFRVAFNLARSRLRRLGAERRAHARSGPDRRDAVPVDVAAAVAVQRALALLPPRQRQAVVLRFYGDLPVAEVARAMGCRPGTVKAHLHQGLAALRLAGLADDPEPPSEEQP
ncbi:MAG TPA: sigma-70 family RNA polymerase sigma factor [Iamia sp.]